MKRNPCGLTVLAAYQRRLCCAKSFVWKSALPSEGLSYVDAFAGVRPTGVKRIRLTCPECGRRLLSSVGTCEDGCCIIHELPPHKSKKAKKPGHKKTTRLNNKQDRRRT